jgi:hypothetical protein
MQNILWASEQNPWSPPTGTILRYTNMNMRSLVELDSKISWGSQHTCRGHAGVCVCNSASCRTCVGDAPAQVTEINAADAVGDSHADHLLVEWLLDQER